ncbi:MAG: adenosylcobalamin-dependent ribonucleoside-diphosphate reductase [Chloroflexota bacterium]|nr:adenosylcobalamin-dependent ribonucleoside-diphosphate reductase [Chloroflexota bacterium]
MDRPIRIGPNGLDVLQRRYIRKGPDGEPIETVSEMFWRVAYNVALPEETWGEQPESIAGSFYDLLTDLRFFPNSPTFTGAGTPLGQLAACFVLAIDDDMGKDSAEGIFSTLRTAALIQQTGGGNGFSFSRLRPKGDPVNSSAGVASGPVGFLKVYDAAFGEIAQGGTRRGANMGVLRIDHPDIEEFIAAKAEEGSVTNFNISVGVTDVFMEAVQSDGDFDLVSPRSAVPIRSVRARDLFAKIVHHAYRNGEPGVLFVDAANRSNPVPHLYELEATNPCGEQWLGPYENCCLGSVNLSEHVTREGQVDWDKLEQTVLLATRFLDDVVSANKYVPAVSALKEAAHRVRRIGLGIMGLADMMYKLHVRYGSDESIDLAGQAMEFVRFHAMRASIDLARERGAFPAITGSIYDPENLQWQPPTPLKPYTSSYGRPELDWGAIEAGIKSHGIRNGAQTTVAPTGTIGTVTGCEGYGCEPVFALAYTRYVKEQQGDVPLTYVSPLFMAALDGAGLLAEERQEIIDSILLNGTCQQVEGLPEDLRNTFVVSQDVTPAEHVMMQAALQRFVDNSISKTCNFSPDAVPQDVEAAYMMAWELGCKGLTVYVTGSRSDVVLEINATAQRRALSQSEQNMNGQASLDETLNALPHEYDSPVGLEGDAPESSNAVELLPYDAKRPRPRRLHGSTYRRLTPLGTAYVTVNDTEDNEPFEVFMNVGKAGSDVAAVSEALGRLISLILRIPSSLTPTERIQQVVYQMNGIGGGRHLGFGPHRVRSLPDAIAQVLEDHLSEAPPPPPEPAGEQLTLPMPRQIGDLCPDCGNSTLLNVEGCRKCHVCGYSEC